MYNEDGVVMKRCLLFLIRCYKNTVGNFHYHCRFVPSCSTYAYEAIERFGAIKGTYLSIKRILRCNPWGKPGVDPVPERKKV